MNELPDIDHIEDPQARVLLQLFKVMLEDQRALNARLTSALEAQQARLDELTRLLYGPKSERVIPVDRELAKRQEDDEQAKKEKKKKTQRKRRTNKQRKKKLPEENVEHKLSEQPKCQECGDSEFSPLGKGEISFEYEYIPAQLLKRKHVREKRICQCGHTIVTAEGPARVGEKSHHGPGLHAHIVVSKCLDSIPLYRQSKQFARVDIPLERSTLCDLFHRTAKELKPLYVRLLEKIVASKYVNADETRMPVQAKKKVRTAWMWTFLSDSMIGFVFSFSRSGQTPVEVLATSAGMLQVDGHTGYNKVCLPSGRERVGCWAHCRRKFFDAKSTAPIAEEALKMILSLYEVEYEAAARNVWKSPEHLAMRKLKSQDVLDEFHKWLLKRRKDSPPKSPLGRAVTYAINQWSRLRMFVDDVELALDNNIAERALRPIALGRKNFLFVGSEQAGENLAILQSLTSTCVAHQVDPQAYLTDVLIRIQCHPMSRIDELLPMNWKPQS